jgi:hypothetical protein
MDSPLNGVVYEIGSSDYLDRLPAYDTYTPNVVRLNGVRMILDAFNYAPYSMAFPYGNTSGLTFGAFDTKNGSLQIPPNSFLMGISGFCCTTITDPTTNTSGSFRFAVTDKGSGLGLTERSFVFYRNLSGESGARLPVNGPNLQSGQFPFAQTRPAQIYWLDSPLIITRPGQIQVAVTNLLNISIVAQFALHFAYPINNISVNTPAIKPV